MCKFAQLYACHELFLNLNMGPWWPWSHGSWIYNYLCNQCLSPLIFWVWISIRARCTTLCDKVCQWLAWFTPGTPDSSTNKTDCHDITEILFKEALSTIKQTNKHTFKYYVSRRLDLYMPNFFDRNILRCCNKNLITNNAEFNMFNKKLQIQ